MTVNVIKVPCTPVLGAICCQTENNQKQRQLRHNEDQFSHQSNLCSLNPYYMPGPGIIKSETCTHQKTGDLVAKWTMK